MNYPGNWKARNWLLFIKKYYYKLATTMYDRYHCYMVTVILLLLFKHPVQGQRNHLLFENSFETVNSFKEWFSMEKCCPYSIKQSTLKAREGKYSARFELYKSDPEIANGVRAELLLPPETHANIERWYGFSIYLPDSYVPDSVKESLAQWHDRADLNLGMIIRSPPLALLTENDKWYLNVLWAKNKTNNTKATLGHKLLELGNIDRNEWTDWVFHIRFSHEEEGLIEVWKNNQQLVHEEGPNCYNDERGPYFKAGIYKWVWRASWQGERSKTSHRIIFFDSVRVGDEHATYKDVAPGN